MKHNVKISTYSMALTLFVLCLIAIVVYEIRTYNLLLAMIMATGILTICVSALFYMPMSVSVNDRELCVNRPLCVKSIPLNGIVSVKLCQPTMAAKLLCGSGGWFGYWGWFSEWEHGKYFAYYGRSSDCFLVTLKDGRKYMLGCQNPQSMVDFIHARLK